MLRLLAIAALVIAAYRLIAGRWPWEKRVPKKLRELERARALLGLPAGAGRADIIAAHRRAIVTHHPDRGGSNTHTHDANAARDLLLGALPHSPDYEPKEPI